VDWLVVARTEDIRQLDGHRATGRWQTGRQEIGHRCCFERLVMFGDESTYFIFYFILRLEFQSRAGQ
jgi:hypothetical protein